MEVIILNFVNDLTGARNLIKMSSLLNGSNVSSKPEAFNINDIEAVGDSEEQN